MEKLVTILVCTLVLMASCTTNKRKNFVILIDNSTSVPEKIMLNYINTIQETVLPNMGEKDKLTVQFIDACSQTKAERIYTVDLAEIDFSKHGDGINNKEDSSKSRMKRFLTDSVKNEIEQIVLEKRIERSNCGSFTDIVNALNEAKLLVDNKKNYKSKTDKILNDAKGDDNYEYETCLVIFSDMVNENSERTFDFTRFGKLKEEEVNKKVEELKELDKIPDLAGVKVLVYGATSTASAGPFAGKQIENIKRFWELFFKSAGADLKGYGYDTKIEIRDYLVKNDD